MRKVRSVTSLEDSYAVLYKGRFAVLPDFVSMDEIRELNDLIKERGGVFRLLEA